jgi:hypothetical protein
MMPPQQLESLRSTRVPNFIVVHECSAHVQGTHTKLHHDVRATT